MRLSLLLVLFCLFGTVQAQSAPDTTKLTYRLFRSSQRYAVNPAISLPLIAGGGFASQQRLLHLQDKDRITPQELAVLNRKNVPGIDRIALRRDFDKHKQALIQSDYFFNTGQWAPFGLFLWKKYRQDWFDISLMYLEAQVTQGLFYGFAPFGPTLVDRYRPTVYYDESSEDTRPEGNNKNSMFSGHVSTMSTGFYFMARMIDDYNPQLNGMQRALIYTAATLPSLYGGWLRVKGLKHYPTDVMIGLGVGAISGIGVPSLHKWWKQRHPRSRMSLRPVYGGGAAGLAFGLQY